MNTFGFASGPLLVRLANNEKGYYSNLHQQADPHDTNKIGGAEAVQFFKRSGLHVDELKKIWLLSSSNGETLNREEFYIALKLISYAQNAIEVSKESIIRGTPSALPKFQSKIEEIQKPINEDIYKIHAEQEKKYQVYVKQLDPYNSNFIQTTMALEMFKKTQLPEYTIQSIMNIVEQGLASKLKITVQQYTVIVHLISLNRQGVTIPTSLPSILAQYLQVSLAESPPKQEVYQSDFGSFGTFQSTPTITPTIKNPSSANNLLDFDSSFKMDTPVTRIDSQKTDKYSAFDSVPSLEPEPIMKLDKVDDSRPPQIAQKNAQKPPQQQQSYYVEETTKPPQNETQQLQQMQQIQIEFSNQHKVKQVIAEEVYQTIQSNVLECSQILKELRAQNDQMLKEKDQEVLVLETLNEQYRTIVQKFRDEADDLQSELKLIESRRKQAIHSITSTVNEMNQQLGLNLRTRQETQRRDSAITEDISSYAQGLLQDMGKTFNQERQQRLQIDEHMLKELKEQKVTIQSLEKQIKKLSTPSRKIDYKIIDRQPIELTYEPSEGSNVVDKEERDQSLVTGTVRRGSQQGTMSKIFTVFNNTILMEPIKSVQVKKTPVFNDYPDSPPQSKYSPPVDMESQSAPLKHLQYNKQESIASAQQQFSSGWIQQEQQKLPTPSIYYSQTVDYKQTWASSEYVGGDFDKPSIDKTNSSSTIDHYQKPSLEQLPSYVVVEKIKSAEVEEVQIEVDLTHQFGTGVWNDFDSNYTQAFGQPAQVTPDDGFGFGLQTKDKTDEFDAFKW